MDKKYIKFNLALEYPDFTGENPVVIISELSKEKMLKEFPELKNRYPLEIYTTAQWEKLQSVFRESWKNDMKYIMREIRHGDMDGYVEGNTEKLIKNYDNNSVECEFNKKENRFRLKQAMKQLNENQKRRVCLYYFQGLTYREIAEIEGVSDKSVRESVSGAIKKIKKYF